MAKQFGRIFRGSSTDVLFEGMVFLAHDAREGSIEAMNPTSDALSHQTDTNEADTLTLQDGTTLRVVITTRGTPVMVGGRSICPVTFHIHQ